MKPTPIYMGAFDAIHAEDVIDLHMDFVADLDEGDAISTVAFTLTDPAGKTVAGAVGAYSLHGGRCDFRLTAPEGRGWYGLTAQLALDDGQKITHTARLLVA